jgi:hypothetical protein
MSVFNITKDQIESCLISDFKKNRERAYTVGETAQLVNRHKKYMPNLVTRGIIPGPTGSQKGGQTAWQVRSYYSESQVHEIRDIRASEKRFYQKVRDLLALSSDYDPTDSETKIFFAESQNKLLYAVTGQTAAEIVISRADSEKSNMALTSWKGEIVRKQDIFIAKNYLSQDEIDTLNRLTVIFLETAELRVKERKDLTIAYWKENINKLLEFNDKKVLQDAGRISHSQMETKVAEIYEEFDKKRKNSEAREIDLKEIEELDHVIKQNKNRS